MSTISDVDPEEICKGCCASFQKCTCLSCIECGNVNLTNVRIIYSLLISRNIIVVTVNMLSVPNVQRRIIRMFVFVLIKITVIADLILSYKL